MEEKTLSLANKIAAAVAQAGGRAYYVGGYVRDRILGYENKDIDIEIHGIAADTLEDLLRGFGEPIQMGKSFGIYQIRHVGMDISLPRSEKDAAVTDPFIGLKKAAERRDFTMNALMQDVLTGEIVDFFGGRDDIVNHMIRQVSDRTFLSDPLRVFRAAQFAARFGFMIDSTTVTSASCADVSDIAGERVMTELEKVLLKAERPSVFFEEMRRMCQLSDWFLELEALIDVPQNPVYHPEGDVWAHTMQVVDEAAKLRGQSQHPFWFMLAALCHDFGKTRVTEEKDGAIHAYGHETEGLALTEQFLGRITTNVKLKQYVLNMVELHMKPNAMARNTNRVKSFMKLFDGSVSPEDLLLLSKADYLGRIGAETDSALRMRSYESIEVKLYDMLSIFHDRMAQPYVMGRDLMQAGVEPGALMGEALQYAHKLRLAGLSKEKQLTQTLGWLRAVRRKEER